MAPEIYAGFQYDHSVDYWSFGILIFEMIYSLRPFQANCEEILQQMICENPVIFPRQITGHAVPQELKDIITKLLNKSQNERLNSFAEFRNHPAFVSYDWEGLEQKTIRPNLIPDLENPFLNFDDDLS
jgi:serine/threonine protein kinase